MTELHADRSVKTNQRYFIFLAGLAVVLTVASFVFQRLTVPILGGVFVAYLSVPFVRFFEVRLKIKAFAASLIWIFSLTGLLIFGIFQLVPVIYLQLSEILDLVPEAFKLVELKWLPMLKQSVAEAGFPEFVSWLEQISLTTIIRQIGNNSGAALEQLWAATPSVLGQILNVVLIPFVALFLLIDYRRIRAVLFSLMPLDTRPSIMTLTKRLNNTLSAVIVGQLIIAAIMGVLYMAGLTAIGLSSGIAIGAIAGVCRIVPYLDVVVGIGLSLIVILTEFSSWAQVIAMFSVFLAAQTIDGMFLTPKIIGNRVGLHPMIVVLAVLAFFDWFGFSGILLALPVVAIGSVLVAECVAIYKSSRFYSGDA